jgi:hypothetical protein
MSIKVLGISLIISLTNSYKMKMGEKSRIFQSSYSYDDIEVGSSDIAKALAEVTSE